MSKSVVREGEKLGKNRREGVKGRAMRSDVSGVTQTEGKEVTSNSSEMSHLIHKGAATHMQTQRPAGLGTIWQHEAQTLSEHIIETVVMNRLRA